MLLNSFKRLLALGLLLTLAAGTTGCASDPIRADYDSTVDFSQYRTYNFYADAGPEATNYQSFFSQYMVAAISREMEKRGYTKSNDPDLLVNFNANLQEKTKVTTTSSPDFGYYGYRGGFYDPWMGYGYNSQTHVSQYTEGTFNIDLVDAKRKQLVWEAVGVGRVSQKTFDELEERVNRGVANFFAKYPFVAGSGVPGTTQ